MKSSNITSFAAGILVGALGFGGIAVHAKMVALNSAIGGVLPNSKAYHVNPKCARPTVVTPLA